jgi:hypothetical protein
MGVPDVVYFRKRLEMVMGLMEQAYGLRLPILPPFRTVDSIKTFCTSFSLNNVPAGFHRGEMVGRGVSFITGKECGSRNKPGRREWASFCHTLFMFRKILPSPEPDLDGLIQKLTRESVADPDFIKVINRVVAKEFKLGWDKKFIKAVKGITLPLRSFYEKKSRGQTSRSYILSMGFSREEFQAYIELGALPINRKRRLAAVREGGKTRVVTIASAFQHAFAPFSNIFYNHLSKKSWLCRGDVSPYKMRDFVKEPGEVFVSGDYESATDSLNMAHSKLLLAAVLQRCTFLPPGYGEALLDSLNPVIDHAGSEFVMSSGQLMGDKLSFPLLCLYNFVAFKSCVRRKVPLKINGDDIAFRASRDEAESWMDGVSSSGLVLHRGKTQVSPTFFSLNSVIFEARNKARPRLVSFIRSKPFFGKKDELCLALHDRWNASLVGHHTVQFRNFCLRKFIGFNYGWLRESQVSLLRGHRIRVWRELVERCRLWDVECFYRVLPPKDDKLRAIGTGRPAGVVSVERSRRNLGIAKTRRAEIVERYIEYSWSSLSLECEEEEHSGLKPGPYKFVKVRDVYNIKDEYSRFRREVNFEELLFSRRVKEPVMNGRTVEVLEEDITCMKRNVEFVSAGSTRL